MSDSEGAVPSDAVVEKTLRGVVAGFYKANELDSVTLKRVRAAASTKLHIADDFFKTSAKWKSKSAEVIKDEVDRQEDQKQDPASSPASSKPAPKPKTSAPAPAQKRKSVSQASKPAPRKKRRESTPPEDDDVVSEKDAAPVDSDSDLSSLIDETPPRKKKPAAASSKQAVSSKQDKPAKAAKPDSNVSPQEEEIKRLQSQLVKCGVRKLWGKELKPFETPRDKISHLKELLADVGMTGRFSEEKARQIKEARELAADLETIQERNKQWGQSDEDEEAAGRQGRRRRAAAQNLAELDQFDDSDEDSD